jgi:hypothetical protein
VATPANSAYDHEDENDAADDQQRAHRILLGLAGGGEVRLTDVVPPG